MSAVNMDQKLFDELLAGDRPVLVDFWAPWCGYCRRISAPYDRIAEEHQDHLTVGKVNVDEEAQPGRGRAHRGAAYTGAVPEWESGGVHRRS